jgi:hypothetical protein
MHGIAAIADVAGFQDALQVKDPGTTALE